MEICRVLAGYSYGRADLVRRAMAKKKHDVMQRERSSFIYGEKNSDGNASCCGAVANGVDEQTANEIFDEMVGFASYAFNKSHAAAYAYLAYQTAYLKYHYFKEYMAALMSSVIGNTDKLIEYVEECRSAKIKILRPDINKSQAEFRVEGEHIRYGLLAVKNLGLGVIKDIISEREKNGDFYSLQNFCERTVNINVSKVCVEYLIKSGAFDGLGANRRQMMRNYEYLMDSADNFAKHSNAPNFKKYDFACCSSISSACIAISINPVLSGSKYVARMGSLISCFKKSLEKASNSIIIVSNLISRGLYINCFVESVIK